MVETNGSTVKIYGFPPTGNLICVILSSFADKSYVGTLRKLYITNGGFKTVYILFKKTQMESNDPKNVKNRVFHR